MCSTKLSNISKLMFLGAFLDMLMSALGAHSLSEYRQIRKFEIFVLLNVDSFSRTCYTHTSDEISTTSGIIKFICVIPAQREGPHD